MIIDENVKWLLNNTSIRCVSEKDLEQLRCWRNEKENSKFLSERPYITEQMQKSWYTALTLDQRRIVFVIDETEMLRRLVGSISIYNIDGCNAEIGQILIGNKEARGHGVGYNAFCLAMYYGIQQLKIDKYRLTVHEDNVSAKKIYDHLGFIPVGNKEFYNGGYEVIMEWEKDENTISELLREKDIVMEA